jgi:hypothetical protein
MANPSLITGQAHHRSTGIPKILLRAARVPKSVIRIPQRYTKPLLKIIFNLPMVPICGGAKIRSLETPPLKVFFVTA